MVRQFFNSKIHTIIFIVSSSLLLFACGTVPTKQIFTKIDISATPDEVWDILVNFEKYPEWNPYHISVTGNPAVGEKLGVTIHKPNNETVEIEPYIMRIKAGRELTWGGGIRGIFYGEHIFLLAASKNGDTRLIHKEEFTGFAVPLASLETIQEGYELMNKALKTRAEAHK